MNIFKRYGKRNKNAVMTLNELWRDDNDYPIGMKEAQTKDTGGNLSSRFGTERDVQRGRGYEGDGTLYIAITGLLTTDTISVMDGSDLPTCTTDGQLDIADGDLVFGISIYRDGTLIGFYKCDEGYGTVCYDSSGNGNNGTITNATTTTSGSDGSIHQYQNVYSYQNEIGYNILTLGFHGNGSAYIRSASLGGLNKSFYDGFTLSCDFQNSSSVNNEIILAANGIDSGSQIIQLRFVYGKIQLICVNAAGTGGNYVYSSTNTYDDGEVHSAYISYVTDTKFIFKIDNEEIVNTSSPASDQFNTIILYYIYVLNRYLDTNVGYSVVNNVVLEGVLEYGNSDYNTTSAIYDKTGNGYTGVVYNYYDGFIINNESFIPRNELIPTEDVLGNTLKYIGKCPSKALFTGSNCFLGDGVAYMTGNVLTTDTITAFGSSSVPTCTTDGQLDFIDGEKYYGVTIDRSGTVIAYLFLCEFVINADSTTYRDSSGNSNNFTLIDGSLTNEGKQNELHWLQEGYYIDVSGNYIQLLLDKSSFSDGTALSLGVINDGYSFLNSGCTLTPYQMAILVQAEQNTGNNFFTDGTDVVDVSFDDFTGNEDNQHFDDISETDKVKNIRMYSSELTGVQLNTELKITNNI